MKVKLCLVRFDRNSRQQHALLERRGGQKRPHMWSDFKSTRFVIIPNALPVHNEVSLGQNRTWQIWNWRKNLTLTGLLLLLGCMTADIPSKLYARCVKIYYNARHVLANERATSSLSPRSWHNWPVWVPAIVVIDSRRQCGERPPGAPPVLVSACCLPILPLESRRATDQSHYWWFGVTQRGSQPK